MQLKKRKYKKFQNGGPFENQGKPEDFLTDPFGRPVIVPLKGAEVVGDFEPRDEDEASIYKNLGFSGVQKLREVKGAVREDRGEFVRPLMDAARYIPILGETLDAAEVVNAYETGSDFSGDEVDPNLLLGLTTAGYLVPNLIEKPIKALIKPIKKEAKNLLKRRGILQDLANQRNSALLSAENSYSVFDDESLRNYTEESRKIFNTKKSEIEKRASEGGRAKNSFYVDASEELNDLNLATQPLTKEEIAAVIADADLAINNPNLTNTLSTLQGERIPPQLLKDRVKAVGTSDEWYLDPVLSSYFGDTNIKNSTPNLDELVQNNRDLVGRQSARRYNLNYSNFHREAHASTESVNKKTASLAATGALATAALATATAAPQSYRNAARRKLGLPQDLPDLASKKSQYIDLSNRRLDYVENDPNEEPEVNANLILGGEFVEDSDAAVTVRNASTYKDAPQVIKLPSIQGEVQFNTKEGLYYGVEDGKLLAGKAELFQDDTKIVPLRYNPRNIKEAVVADGSFRIVDDNGNPIYQNIRSEGKIILYSPETKKSAFFYSNSPEESVNFTNKFLADNQMSAIPIVIDNGRYQYYFDTKGEGTIDSTGYKKYIANDISRNYKHGYNITAFRDGGKFNILKKK